MEIYLDNAALEQPKKEVIDTVIDVLTNHWNNPNAVYEKGLEAKRLIEDAKTIIANEINCNSDDLIMCSCGSEANSLATTGYIRANDKTEFVTSVIEHASILENPYAKSVVKVDREGFYSMNTINNIYDSLVSLQFANSEIGTIQDMKHIISVLHKNRCVVHCDATAVFGKVKINVKDLNIDMMTATSPKIGGVLGSAFLYKKSKIKLEPFIYGHDTLRAGTPNTVAICAFGKAVELLDWSAIKKLQEKRDFLINKLLDNPNISLNGARYCRLSNNINICIHNCNLGSQELVAMLDMYGIQVSASSACNAGLKEPSKVLMAIGLSTEETNHSLRITLREDISYADLYKFTETLEMILNQFG